jgi:hypothetical protein
MNTKFAATVATTASGYQPPPTANSPEPAPVQRVHWFPLRLMGKGTPLRSPLQASSGSQRRYPASGSQRRYHTRAVAVERIILSDPLLRAVPAARCLARIGGAVEATAAVPLGAGAGPGAIGAGMLLVCSVPRERRCLRSSWLVWRSREWVTA